MSDTIIKVENLGKKYIIGHQAQQGGWKPNRGNYVALRDVVANNAKSLGKRLLGKERNPSYTTEEFWALKDINFEIKQGEVVGIIGRNGAGKSTLLKILSRITEPTTGRIELRGRVASLLEVGTGFHPELTGRENIYLNGSILGMSRIEIRKKFDEIVDFAEVEKFLDTPVKRYSSGMYVRLAFAVAAHLEPEILVVDEVLAVGDAAFQKKCLGKMEDVATIEGRTVLFVSHNMGAVEKLCRKGFVLSQGEILFSGTQYDAIKKYLIASQNLISPLRERKDRNGNGQLKITDIKVKDDKGNVLEFIPCGGRIYLWFDFEAYQAKLKNVIASFTLRTQLGTPVFLLHNRLTQNDFGEIPQKGSFICCIDKISLTPGDYWMTYSILNDGLNLDSITDAYQLKIVEGNYYPSGEIPPSSHALLLAEHSWLLFT